MAQFVPLSIETTQPSQDLGRLMQMKRPAQSIPFVWIIRADGEVLYGDTGVPDPTAQFLKAALQKSGASLSAKQVGQLQESLEAAKKLHESGDLAGAVGQLDQFAGLVSYAEAATAANTFMQQLIEEGKQKLTEAQGNLQSPETAFQGALALLEIRRAFEKVPDLASEANTALREARKNAAQRTAIEQAQDVDRARATESLNAKRAATLYSSVIAKYPDTPAAAIAKERLEALASAGADVAASTASTKSGTSSPTEDKPAAEESGNDSPTEQDLKKASSYLRLAATFAKTRPEKAREYAEKALKLVPEDSKLAADAKAILAKLGSE